MASWLILRPAYSPVCMATSATPGSLSRLIMSPVTRMSGWPGRDRSGPHSRRPARSCSAPVALATIAASGGAATPAVHKMLPASNLVALPSWSVTSRPRKSMWVTSEPMCNSTPSLPSWRAARADSFSPNIASGALPASNSKTFASRGSMCRYSRRSVFVATSRICPASSTPVGPAPTRAKVSQRARSAGSLAESAISNEPNTRRRILSASSTVFIPGAIAAYSSCPK